MLKFGVYADDDYNPFEDSSNPFPIQAEMRVTRSMNRKRRNVKLIPGSVCLVLVFVEVWSLYG